jgi:hypothetical protein
MSRLSNDEYQKPPITYTDSLSKEEIKNFLKDYEEISSDKISTVKKGTHLRYFSKNDDGTYKFRLGGNLIVNNTLPNYIVLSNKKKSWSVQTHNTIFFVEIKK